MKRDEDKPAARLSDTELDALVREVAEIEADEAATKRAVLARIAAAQRRVDPWGWLPVLDMRMATAALAILVVAAGAGGYALPDLLGGVETIRLLELAAGGLPIVDIGELAVKGSGRG